MAYQTRGRSPLFDSETQAVLERRAKELVGLILLVIGGAGALTLMSYVPDDPSWLAATSDPAQNYLGRLGASIAAPLVMMLGWGAWGFPVAFAVWGGRFAFHQGEDRVFLAALVPIAVVVLSLYAATCVPGPAWQEDFGLGGLLGDFGLGMLLSFLGVSNALGLKLVALVLMVSTLALGAFVLGFDRDELGAIGRWLVRSTVVGYSTLVDTLLRGGQGAAGGASRAVSGIAVRRAERRRAAEEATQDMPEDVLDDEEPWAEEPMAEESQGRMSRLMGAVRRRAAEPVSALQDAPAQAGPRQEPPLMRRGEPSRQVAPVRHDFEGDVVDETPFDADDGASDRIDRDAPEDDPLATIRADAQPEPEPAPRVQAPARRSIKPSSRARAEAEPQLAFDSAENGTFTAPPLSLLLDPSTIQRHVLSESELEENARMLESVLDDYGVKGEIVSVRPGPVVTMYELEPAPGLKASRVIGLADDIARSMSALSARVSTVPGRSVIGIELPNEKREMCVLREILAASSFGDTAKGLPLALGKDIGGDPIVANLAKMPHLLIAGTTGSGKSVAINTMILSLLYKLTPEECRLIMIDPKMLELSVYDGIPHLLSPVVTDPKKAVVALKWVVAEMEDRYRKMSKMGVRNIEGYNGRVREALAAGETFERTVQTGFDDETGDPIFETEEIEPEVLPFIVVVVDEMADLMMVAGKEIEACIQRLAQMARASGIHLIMATQRPSVDVITGTIKANFPTRISFQVTSKIDSRTILGEQGAEQLLGMGDMLFMAGGSRITRVHGPFCSDEEVEEIVTYLKQFGPPDYKSGVVEGPDDDKSSDIDAVLGLGGGNPSAEGDDALYDRAVAIAAKDRKCSTSYIQRKLAIGYNKAARLVEQMEEQGVVSSANHVGKREVLIPEPV